MQTSWDLLMERRFTPAEAERLTGVSTTLQRKWVQLHFSSMPSSDWQWDVSAGGHRRFTWAGIQMLAFFRDVTGDLGSSFRAQQIGPMADYPGFRPSSPTLPHSHVFGVDFRDYEHGDMFLWTSFGPVALPVFLTGTIVGIERYLKGGNASRLYLFNVSAMQRQLVTAVEEAR
jgi:hypothetical protein